ncbi:MAG: hypothetical protein KBD29_03175 [Candidatus Magasanikbacteria bacterium]|nr:hypothetical protein [Candidatus Magasanikbacteria bacterium]
MMENINWFWWILMYLATCLFIGHPLAVTACSVRNSWDNPMITEWHERLTMILCFPATFMTKSLLAIVRRERTIHEQNDMPGLFARVIETDGTYILVTSLLWPLKMVWTLCASPLALVMIGAFFCLERLQRLWRKIKKGDSTAH